MNRLLVLAALVAATSARGLPVKPKLLEGFQPVSVAQQPSTHVKRSELQSSHISRGPLPVADYGPPRSTFNEGFGRGSYGAPSITKSGGFDQGSIGGAVGEPDKTIYVRLPEQNSGPLPPRAAGPPQKHYRIVIIRSPSAPAPQPILPPRTEQKTLIYVLHQRPKLNQQIVETPVVKHPPQVLFVGYDDELTGKDLQKLAEGDHSGFTVTSQDDQVGGGFQPNQVLGSLSGGYQAAASATSHTTFGAKTQHKRRVKTSKRNSPPGRVMAQKPN